MSIVSTPVNAASDLDVLPSDVEIDLRHTVRDLLADRCTPDAVTAMYDGDRSVVEPLWRALAVDLGLAGLLVPEELGGAGASAVEAAAVLEELGRAAAPVPFLTSSVVATTALLACVENDVARKTITAMAEGELTAALVVPLSTAPEGDLPNFNAIDGRVTGSARSVAGALESDVLVVPVQTIDGVVLYVVEQSAATITPVVSLDMGRQVADVTLHGAPGHLVLTDGDAVIQSALLAGAGLLASEQVGIARWCLEETVAYLKVRKQFGRVVGGFQALKHRFADLYAEVESASAAARYAAAALAAGTDVPIAVRVAAAYCSDIAVHAGEEAVQLHGGIGMTWEHPTHLYLKKAKADQIAFGTAGAHRAALAGVIDLRLAEA
ncbi:acyl-CoA dehydrogenase family protein [Nocardioides sp. GCM10030258]|uniref:acyl-CoA dehydrogenase family protein n=1 Tax=unclassified Nocardioides TaxID=2615069 RepID=UPI003623A20F